MKRKGWLLCLFGGLLGLLGCAQKQMPAGDLVSVEYTQSGTMAGFSFFGSVEQDSTGSFVAWAMKESYGPLFKKQVGPEAMRSLRRIIEEEGMYAYREVYRPSAEVLDGWGWSFSAKFSDGSVISSHGSNASPKGNGLVRINNYLTDLIEDGIQMEESETEEYLNNR